MYGKIIKELRLENKLTQKQLAEKLEISQKTLSRYELEEFDLSTEMIAKICKFFNITADYLLGIEK